MKGDKLLVGMTHIDNNLIDFAESYKMRKRISYKTILSIAASFCLVMSIVIIFATNFQNAKYEYGEDGKINISSIPGAIQINTSNKVFLADNGNIYPPEEFIDVHKNNGSTIVYGSVKNVKTVSITDGDLIWYITTFEIDVIDAIKKVDKSSTVKATSISCYEKGNPNFIGSLSSNIKIDKNTTGLFLLKNSPADKYEINGEKYSADQFASYYAMSQYDCDGKNFDYYGTTIEVDKLRSP
ncbi:MAG: hypothetical protein IJB65_06280 [Clostridia bacterium]|nr:hypothetical protein [Clostridia bacterium]